ncbi:hypothetical protein M0813_19180 [Anaeramoeba flamelloides]|uniref:Peptidase M20 dimerisation domain-containing protein n=1 Tax=Anaeramoeba flamelloides TaxID=1746091 RepID=A0ABQ8YPH9_9EUKA|nr:hypothetical protein M0813_19180 [Anaeramoeba flamelloides]
MLNQKQQEEISRLVNKIFEEKAIESIKENIRIPVVSPEYDPDFLTNGLIEKTLNVGKQWLESLGLEGLETKIVRCPKSQTPLLYATIRSNKNRLQTQETKEKPKNVLLYGHADRMPVNEKLWTVTGPREPIIKDSKMYGRGACDDVYSIYANSIVIYTLQQMGLPHDNFHLILESEEESGSKHLFSILETLDLPEIDLAVITDGGGPNEDHFWVTSSVRGLINGNLTVEVLKSGVHSGDGTGIIPSPFRISRLLLQRIEDEQTGEMKLPELFCEISEEMETIVENSLSFIKSITNYNSQWIDKEQPIMLTKDIRELITNKFFRPGLEITGCEGLPKINRASNVCRSQLKLKLSIRLPPIVELQPAINSLKEALETNPPYGAKITYNPYNASQGWFSKNLDQRLESSANRSSLKFFEKPFKKYSLGGTLPLLHDLSLKFPKAQILVTGAGTRISSAHGPNEHINLIFLKKVISCLTQIIGEFADYD